MKKLYISIGVILAVLTIAAIYLLIFQQPATAPTNDQQAETTTDSTEASVAEDNSDVADQNQTITYSDDGFSPADLAVKEGTKITIKNDSSRTLDFASDDHPTHLTNSELNVGLIEPGASKNFTPSKGTWGFHDHLNASATGQIVVE